MLKSTFLAAAVLFGLGTLVTGVQAQRWNNGPVVVSDQSDGRGTTQAFDVGEYRNDRNQFGSLRNDSAASVYVANGYRVRFCETESRNGSGRCEEFGPGTHNLRYAGSASYIQVSGRGWNGNNNGGGWGNNNGNNNGNGNNNNGRAVTLFDDRDFRGASQSFDSGRYLNSRNQFGGIGNDRASSVVVDRGFSVRICDSEGGGAGSGRCEEYGPGSYNLRYSDSASYIEVRRGNSGGWGGNNGNGNGNGNGGWNGGNDDRGVTVFSERDQDGDQQQYGAGIFRNDRRSLGNIKNDDASSIFVPRGYRVRVCDSEAGGVGGGSCEEYGPGSYNLRYNDRMSFIRVWRNGGF
jgi:hypothetical protein